MIGSEKQIAWATEIKTQAENISWAEVQEANELVIGGCMPPEWAATVMNARNEILASLETDTKSLAKNWIDNRQRILLYAGMVNRLAQKRMGREQIMEALAPWRSELGLPPVEGAK
jgi:hypothetical protein